MLQDISIFKMLTGGDWIMGEFKGKNPFFFRPRCKLLFSGNVMPGVAESDATAAFANRIKVLLFHHSIPPEKQDKSLKEKLIDESDPIFTLSMRALVDLRKRNYKFTIPADSAEFVQNFAQAQNSVFLFIRECCIDGPEYRTYNQELLNAYKTFCKENAFAEFPRDKFFEILDARPGVKSARFRVGKENRHGRMGIGLCALDGTLERSEVNDCAATDTGVPEKRNKPENGGTENEKM